MTGTERAPRPDGGTAAVTASADRDAVERADRLVGSPVRRREDDRLLTGRGTFLDDMAPVGGLRHLAVLRSPHAHADIVSVDTADAEAMAGVEAVITGEDAAAMCEPFPVTATNPPGDYYALATDRVRYDGEPVAAVVADSPYVAADALEHIDVEYARRDASLDPEAVVHGDAPQLHEAGDVANHRELAYGDVDAAFERADTVVSTLIEVPPTACPPLEPYGVIADYDDGDDTLDLWATFQGPLTMKTLITHVLDLPDNHVRVRVPADQGGGFGTKITTYPYMVLVALASMVAGTPVKWIEARDEHLRASSMHAGRVQYMEGAVDANGSIRGVRIRQYNDYGAYMRPPEPGTVYESIGHWQGPYEFDALAAEQYAVQTNKCPTGPHRGYGQQFHSLALEALVDEMADAIGMDRAEFRRRNFIADDAFPYETLTGGTYDSGQYDAAFTTGLEAFDYDDWMDRRGADGDVLVGVGTSAVLDSHASNMGYLEASLPADARRHPKSGALETVLLAMGPDGTVSCTLTSAPQGQGHETTAIQIVADVLDLPPGEITVTAGFDSGGHPWGLSTGTYSDRFGTIGTTAIARAAKDLRDQIERVGAHLLGAPRDAVEFRDGAVVADDGDAVPLRHVTGATYWNPTDLPDDIEPRLASITTVSLPQAQPVTEDDGMNSTVTNGFGAHFAAVAVDRETGSVEILDYVAVHDSGRVINPLIVEGQIAGATAYGQWLVLHEYHDYDDGGTLQTDTLMDYRMPTAREAAPLRQFHVESPSPFTELGAKGVGDAGTIAAVPALTAAIADALGHVGADVDALPLTPDRVWAHLRDAGEGS